MSKTRLDDFIKSLPKKRQEKIKTRAQDLILREMSIQELRKSSEVTQDELALLLGIGQDNISRMEKRLDMKVSTLNNYIKALGGKLKIIVEMPDGKPVKISGLSD